MRKKILTVVAAIVLTLSLIPMPVLQLEVRAADRLPIQHNSISAGRMRTWVIRDDGSLWAWGDNWQGELGDGTTRTARHSPVRIGTYSDWVSVSAGGGFHTLGIRDDGSLWAWGNNNRGQLGDGTTTHRLSPVRIGTHSDWVSVSAGNGHSLGIRADGSLWAWGDNWEGELGDGTTTDRLFPVRIGTHSDWVSVSAGDAYSLGIRADGSLWAWGDNSWGQLGDGTRTDRRSPVRIGTHSDWVSVSAGDAYSLGIRADGSLWAWGSNEWGQLGDGTTTDRNSPVKIMDGMILPETDVVTPPATDTLARAYGVIIDGIAHTFDPAPQNIGGRMMLPFRAIGEALGMTVSHSAGTVFLSAPGVDVSHVVGTEQITVNGVTQTFEGMASVATGGRTLMSVRMIGTAIGADVQWDRNTRTAVITTR